MGFCVPIILEKLLTVDFYATLFLLPQWEMTALHIDLDADLGRRRCISTNEQTLPSARIKQNEGHTGVALVPRSGCPSSVILSPHHRLTT